MTSLDYTAVALYLLAMLAVGRYYARRTETAEGYLLGNRNMKPGRVGLSLFVTLLSTISLIAIPGELIKHGPWLWLGLLAMPVTVYITCRWVVPKFMGANRLQSVAYRRDDKTGRHILSEPIITRIGITTAYEFLEDRLGPSIRRFAGLLFIFRRCLWMGLIVHVTSTLIVAPLVKVPSLAVAVLLVGVTILYSACGFRAVVAADVIQSGVLLMAVLLTLGIISCRCNWIPTEWPSHWRTLSWGYHPFERLTVFACFAPTLLASWVVSDQMEVQRFLCTSSVKDARRVLIIAQLLAVVATALLVCVGLALMGYYGTADADKLFPRFMSELPGGFKGLLLCGILAAAMSSLSSGINSCVGVWSNDLRRRCGDGSALPTQKENAEPAAKQWPIADRTRPAAFRLTSIIVGAFVFALSLAIAYVPGNLMEIVARVVGVAVAPLGGLFFLAMFVRYAKPSGAYAGLVAGWCVYVWAAFVAPISFVWCTPLCLLTVAAIGMVVSLIGKGGRRVYCCSS